MLGDDVKRTQHILRHTSVDLPCTHSNDKRQAESLRGQIDPQGALASVQPSRPSVMRATCRHAAAFQTRTHKRGDFFSSAT